MSLQEKLANFHLHYPVLLLLLRSRVRTKDTSVISLNHGSFRQSAECVDTPQPS